MKTSLEALPEPKRERVAAIAALLRDEAAVEMVILFGSYARGDWVEDLETGYFSDFDILAVVATEELARKEGMWTALSQRAQALAGRTPVRIIAHDIKELNHELRLGQYFFIDILREGVRLTALSFERGKQTGVAEGFDRGEVVARARDVLTVLEVRGVSVPEAGRARILAEKDPEQLQRWLKKAIVATSLDDVIEEQS